MSLYEYREFNGDLKKPGVRFLLDVVDIIQRRLENEGITVELSRPVALAAVEEIRKVFGGDEVYIPKGAMIDISSRDWAVWKDFNGRNLHELRSKYNLSRRRLEQIIARCRYEDKKQRSC